jgi:hypothetical protein
MIFEIKKLKIDRIKAVNIAIIFFLALTIFFGNKFRERNYAEVPFPGETADEYSFGWLGLSLIKDKYPLSWSGILVGKDYDYQRINVDGIFDKNPGRLPFPLEKPWLYHPPLMGLMVGGYAYLHGARDFIETSVILLRRPMLKIAILNTILIFVLATLLFDKYVGILSAFFYSVNPSIVISSRIAVAENALIPLFLLTLIFALLYIKKKKLFYWTVACVFSSVAVLFKISGVAIPLSLFLIALFFGGSDKKKMVVYSVLSAGLPLMVFALYGAFFSWSTFVEVFIKANANRFWGASSEIFYTVIANPKITKFYTDGWLTASWISLFAISFNGFFKDKNIKFLTISVFSYFIIFLIFGGESYGWYRFPYFPFLMIALAYFLKKLWEETNVFVFSGIMLLPLGTIIHKVVGVENFQQLIPYFRMGVILSLVSFMAPALIKEKYSKIIQRTFIILVFIIAIYFTIKEIYYFNVDKWYFAY